MPLFRKADPKAQVKQSQRQLRDEVHDLEREIQNLKRDEARLTDEIRTAARQNNDAVTRVLAKELVRLREQTSRLQITMAGIRGISTSLSTVAASSSMATSLQNAGRALAGVQSAVPVDEAQKQMKTFAMANMQQDTLQEMFNETIDGVVDTEDSDERTSELVQQLLDDVGMEFAAKMNAAPLRGPAAKAAAPETPQQEGEGDELALQLALLKAA